MAVTNRTIRPPFPMPLYGARWVRPSFDTHCCTRDRLGDDLDLVGFGQVDRSDAKALVQFGSEHRIGFGQPADQALGVTDGLPEACRGDGAVRCCGCLRLSLLSCFRDGAA